MRSKVRDGSALCSRLHHMPGRFGCDSVAPDLSHSTYSSEDNTSYASRSSPLIDSAFRPRWNRNRTDVFPFANQVGDHPVFLANLEVVCFEPR
jgi:hypothetical protein